MKYRLNWRSRTTGYEGHSEFGTRESAFDAAEHLREKPLGRFLEYWVEDTTGRQYRVTGRATSEEEVQ